MPGGFFVDEHGLEHEYSTKTGRAWAQSDDQYSWLDGVGQWFRIEDQLNEFRLFTGLTKLKVTNTTNRGKYQDYYDKGLVKRIEELFPRDIQLGGYKFK